MNETQVNLKLAEALGQLAQALHDLPTHYVMEQSHTIHVDNSIWSLLAALAIGIVASWWMRGSTK